MDLDAKLLVVGSKVVDRSFVNATLAAAGWTVIETESSEEAVAAIAGGSFGLVLLDLTIPEPDGLVTAGLIRRGGYTAIPIIALTDGSDSDRPSRLGEARMDGHVDKFCSAAALVAAVGLWWPDQGASVREALSAMFGRAKFTAIVMGFRGELMEALCCLDAPTGIGERAHRIGGLAGTIGFREVSDTWLALSEGDRGAVGAARIAARKALIAIEREAQFRFGH